MDDIKAKLKVEELEQLLRETDRAVFLIREEHSQLAYTMGRYFGYPQCCTEQFAIEICFPERGDPRERNINGSGFIPCNKHFGMIKRGEIKLHELIEDRICKTPFPIQ